MSLICKAAFLDRDGVINVPLIANGKTFAPTRLEDFIYYDDVPRALVALKAAGFLIVVVTNQPDVATGKMRRDTLEAMHRQMMEQLPIDAVKVCSHVESDGCNCRKPRTGMLDEASQEFGINPLTSVLVGDRWRDIVAGQRFGCHTIYLRRGHLEDQPFHPDQVADSLEEAVASYLQDRNRTIVNEAD